ncbi:MAG: hypothetical protein ACI9W2_001530, partial [Gammaproteobacteria bacterium]
NLSKLFHGTQMKNSPQLKFPSGHSVPIDLSTVAIWDRFDP